MTGCHRIFFYLFLACFSNFLACYPSHHQIQDQSIVLHHKYQVKSSLSRNPKLKVLILLRVVIKQSVFSPDSRKSPEQSSPNVHRLSEGSFPLSCPFKDRKHDIGRPLGNHIKAISPASLPQYSLNTVESYTQATTSHNATIHGVPSYNQCPPMGLPAGHPPANAAAASSCVPHAMCSEAMYPCVLPKHDQHVG